MLTLSMCHNQEEIWAQVSVFGLTNMAANSMKETKWSNFLCTDKNINIAMRPPPVVTGISPAEGPPGTKVIIRGEHLGINAKDVTGMKLY